MQFPHVLTCNETNLPACALIFYKEETMENQSFEIVEVELDDTLEALVHRC